MIVLDDLIQRFDIVSQAPSFEFRDVSSFFLCLVLIFYLDSSSDLRRGAGVASLKRINAFEHAV